MKFQANKKLILILMSVSLVGLFWANFNIAQAAKDEGAYSALGIVGNIIGGAALVSVLMPLTVLFYVLGLAAAGLLLIAGFFVDAVLALSILENPLVITGWELVLNFANLGFVLAIIVIAFATILRRETYAMKNTLAKLIVAALLVNFSLVIAGAFIDASDIVTNIFLKPFEKYNSFSQAIEKIVNPQGYLIVKKDADTTWLGEVIDWTKEKLNMLTLSGQLKFLVTQGLIFGLTLFAFFAMFLLGIMLLIRYVALSILLILSPIVWLFWIFPATLNLWQKWWQNFIRWVIYAPISTFFLYLVIKSGDGIKEVVLKVSEKSTVAQSGKALEGLSAIADLPKQILTGAILGAFIFAAVMMGNYLGLQGAKQAYGLAKKSGKKLLGLSGRMALRGSTGFLRKPGGPEGKTLAQRFQERADKMGWFGRQTLGRLARRTAQLSDIGTRGQMGQYQKQFAKMSATELAGIAATTLDPLKRTMAELALAGKKTYNEDRLLTEDTKKRFTKYGKEKEYGDMELAMGGTWEIHGAAKEVAAAEKAGDADKRATAQEKLEKLQKEFVGKQGKEKISKIDFGKNFGPKPAFGRDSDIHTIRGEALASALMSERPEALGMAAGRLPGNAIPEFAKMIRASFWGNFEKIRNKAIADTEKFNPADIAALKKIERAEGKELGALMEIKNVLKTKDPALHFSAERIGRGLKSLAHSVFEPFSGVAGGPRREREEGEGEESKI